MVRIVRVRGRCGLSAIFKVQVWYRGKGKYFYSRMETGESDWVKREQENLDKADGIKPAGSMHGETQRL